MEWKIIVIVLLIFILADKTLTYVNLKLVEKNFPEKNSIQIERNFAARFFFGRFGYLWGSILFGIVTFFTSLIAFYMLSKALESIAYTAGNPQGIALYVVFLLYAFTIGNNTYFLLKYAKIIP